MFGWVKKIKGLFWNQENTPQEPAVEMVKRKIIDMPFEDKGYEWGEEEEKEYLEEVRERKITRQRHILMSQRTKLNTINNFYGFLRNELKKLEDGNCIFHTPNESEIRTDLQTMMNDTSEQIKLVTNRIEEIKKKIECIKVEEMQ